MQAALESATPSTTQVYAHATMLACSLATSITKLSMLHAREGNDAWQLNDFVGPRLAKRGSSTQLAQAVRAPWEICCKSAKNIGLLAKNIGLLMLLPRMMSSWKLFLLLITALRPKPVATR